MPSRVNVYLPDALAKAVREADIPISAVCQAALEQEVRKVQATKDATSDLERVAGRLKETKQEEDREEYTNGFEAGSTWAKETADFKELRGIIQASEEHWVTWRFNDDESSVPPFLANWLDVNDRGTWEFERGDPFAEGFLEGAAAVFEKVLPLL